MKILPLLIQSLIVNTVSSDFGEWIQDKYCDYDQNLVTEELVTDGKYYMDDC